MPFNLSPSRGFDTSVRARFTNKACRINKVLVRGHQPVAVGGLFKIGALHGPRIGGQAGGNVGVGAQLLGQGGAPGLRQHVARAARKGVAGCMTAGCLIRQCRALRCTHHVPHQRISVCRKVLGGGKAHSAGAVLGGGACHMKRVWGRRGLSACAAPERTDRYRQLGLMHGHWARLSVRSSRRGVVRGEMPASFETEALRAQAAAERTYVYHQLAAGRKEAHLDADVCTDPGCCSAWLSEEAAQEKWGDDFTAWEERIEDAVAATDGQVALYRGEPILAVFHSSSSGRTAEAGDVWSGDVPYLRSVDS